MKTGKKSRFDGAAPRLARAGFRMAKSLTYDAGRGFSWGGLSRWEIRAHHRLNVWFIPFFYLYLAVVVVPLFSRRNPPAPPLGQPPAAPPPAGGFTGVPPLRLALLAMIVLLFISGVFWVRIFLRQRRAVIGASGRACPNCLYDLSGVPGVDYCTECGFAVDLDELVRRWSKRYRALRRGKY